MRTRMRVARIDQLERERHFQAPRNSPAAALALLRDDELDAVGELAQAAQGCDDIAVLLAAHPEWQPAFARLDSLGRDLGVIWA